MKKIIQKALASLLVVAIVITYACNSFADNDYGIQYMGGAPLSASNVNIDPELIDGLSPLITTGKSSPSSSNLWEDGYVKDEYGCHEFKFFRVSYDTSIGVSSGLAYTVSNKQYDIEVNIEKASLDNVTLGDGEALAVGFRPATTFLFGGWPTFSDSECTTRTEGVKMLGLSNGGKLFVQTNIKLHKKDQTDVFVSNGLYFGIIDIDAAQSYKILNPGNELTPESMYAKNVEGLQNPDSGYKNMYVEGGHYIYAQYDDQDTVLLDNTANIYTQLKDSTQRDGLSVVFGFGYTGGSGVVFYANQHTINYVSDPNGTITGTTSERIIAGETPNGSEEEPNVGHKFIKWVADKDVTLTNGTTIIAGETLTMNQIKMVVVDQDVTFTAINEANAYTVNYTSDTNGTITGETTENVTYGSNPTGTTETQATGYSFSHWIADKDVTLTDDTTIEAGEPIAEDELTDIVIAEDITFTAINEINTYTITYTSDENGTIVGEKEEVIEHGSNPTGTKETPNEGYEFKEWIADTDVTLKDGTTIKAGDPIAPDQIPLIVVDQDIKLTAINQAKEELVVPDTGSITKEGNNAEFTIISISTVVALASLLLISLMPKFFRKKIDFGK